MKVTCDSLETFFENIEAEPSECVYNNVIYINRIETLLGDNKENSARYLVVLRVSTIMDLPDGGQYLLITEDECGIDYHDSTQEKEGTKVANVKEEKLKSFCESRNLKIRPGVVDF
jgi:hypothetical protein